MEQVCLFDCVNYVLNKCYCIFWWENVMACRAYKYTKWRTCIAGNSTFLSSFKTKQRNREKIVQNWGIHGLLYPDSQPLHKNLVFKLTNVIHDLTQKLHSDIAVIEGFHTCTPVFFSSVTELHVSLLAFFSNFTDEDGLVTRKYLIRFNLTSTRSTSKDTTPQKWSAYQKLSDELYIEFFSQTVSYREAINAYIGSENDFMYLINCILIGWVLKPQLLGGGHLHQLWMSFYPTYRRVLLSWSQTRDIFHAKTSYVFLESSF